MRLNCYDCKYLDVKGSNFQAKWFCGHPKGFEKDISFPDYPFQKPCLLESGFPSQDIMPCSNPYMHAIYESAVETYKRYWPQYSDLENEVGSKSLYAANPYLHYAVTEIEEILQNLGLTWHDIKHLRKQSLKHGDESGVSQWIKSLNHIARFAAKS